MVGAGVLSGLAVADLRGALIQLSTGAASLWGVNTPFAKARAFAEKFRAARGPAAKRPLAQLRGVAEGVNWPQNKAGMTGDLFIYESIGANWWDGSGITGKSVNAALEGLKGCKTLNVFINCEGGDVFEAKAIYSSLKRFDAEKVIHVDGIAASAATFIAMAGDRIITSPVATWMIHEAWTMAMGPACDLRAVADLLDLENKTIAETYAKQTGASVEEMAALMAAETWMNAAKALELGFTDEITAEEETGDELEASAKTSSPAVALAELTSSRIRASARLGVRADGLRRTFEAGQPVTTAKPASR